MVPLIAWNLTCIDDRHIRPLKRNRSRCRDRPPDGDEAATVDRQFQEEDEVVKSFFVFRKEVVGPGDILEKHEIYECDQRCLSQVMGIALLGALSFHFCEDDVEQRCILRRIEMNGREEVVQVRVKSV